MTDCNVELEAWLAEQDEDGLDRVEQIAADAAAVEGVVNVHEGGIYYAVPWPKKPAQQSPQ